MKSALLLSASATKEHNLDNRSIHVSTYGILFMGTPHQGSEAAGIGHIVLNVASLFVNTNRTVIGDLKRDSSWLNQQNALYTPLSRNFKTMFAYETNKTKTFLGLQKMVNINVGHVAII